MVVEVIVSAERDIVVLLFLFFLKMRSLCCTQVLEVIMEIIYPQRGFLFTLGIDYSAGSLSTYFLH